MSALGRLKAAVVTTLLSWNGDDLRRYLTSIGVQAGDTLMIHASLRAIGPLRDGPETLLDALDAAVGDDGTLLMILGAEIAGLSKERDDYLKKQAEAQFAVPEQDLVEAVRKVLVRHDIRWT